MLIRREVADDAVPIDAVHRSAFADTDDTDTDDGDPAEVGLVRALRADPGWVPALSLVALDGAGTVVGHVVATEGRLGDATAVGIGPLGVRRDVQGRRVGHALMHAVLAAADALDYPLAAVLGDPAYYSRFGFVPAVDLGVTAPDPAWGRHFQARPLATHRGHRGAFVYAAPFGAL